MTLRRDVDARFDRAVANAAAEAPRPEAAGGADGGLAAYLLSSVIGGTRMRGFAALARRMGGVAAIGELAWRAYGRFCEPAAAGEGQRAEDAMPTNWLRLPRSRFVPDKQASTDARELLVLRAIVAAAEANGAISRRQRLLIVARIEAMPVVPRHKALLADEVETPMSYEELAGFAQTPALAAVIFGGSLIAVDGTCAESNAFLGALASRMGLPSGFVRELKRGADRLAGMAAA
ncbi:MAG: DUF533 domain-containing protein [Pseudomonadota bacterium]